MDSNIVNFIATELEAEIITGKLSPGALLQQELLAARFRVSRQPVRAALDVLGAKGLVTRRPDRSVEVSELSAEDAGEVLAIRKLLEPNALSLAIGRLTDHDLLLARQALERFEHEQAPENLVQHDTDFHMALYRACENETMVELIANLRKTNQRAYLGQPLGSKARTACITAHRNILTAVGEQDSETAVKLLIQHFNISKEREH